MGISAAMSFFTPQHIATIVHLLLLFGCCFCSPTAKPISLRAVHAAKYNNMFDSQPTDSNQYSDLDVQDQGQLVYESIPGMCANNITDGKIQLRVSRKWQPTPCKHDALRSERSVHGVARTL